MKVRTSTEKPALMNYTEAGEEFNVSRATLNRWVREGVVRQIKIGGRVFIPRSELDRVLAEAK